MKVRANKILMPTPYLTVGKIYDIVDIVRDNVARIYDDDGFLITILIPINRSLITRCAHIGCEWEIVEY